MGFAGPRLFQSDSGDASSCVAQCQRHHNNVIERADDRQKLGDEVDGREHPQSSEGHRELGSPWDPGVTAQKPDGNRARRKESGEILEQARRKPVGKNEEDEPGAGQHPHCSGHPPNQRHKTKCMDRNDYIGRRR